MSDNQQNDLEEEVETPEDESSNTQEDKTEGPTTSEEWKAMVEDLRQKLADVTRESVKRKEKIRGLAKELEDLRKSGVDNAAVLSENQTLKDRVDALLKDARKFRINESVADIVAKDRISLTDSQALRDLAAFVSSSISSEWDDEDLGIKLPDLVKAELKKRPYLIQAKRAPDIDQTRSGTNQNIPEEDIESVARDFNLPIT